MRPGLIFLMTSVSCSVCVSILLKVARTRGIDVRQAITANYAVALLACWLLLKPDLSALSQPSTPWITLLLLGVLLPSVFLAMANAVRDAGIVRSDAAQRLALFIPLIAAFVLFGETMNARKMTAIALGLLALVFLLKRADGPPGAHDQSHTRGTWLWPAAVWIGYGVVDVLFKQVARTGTAFASSLFAAFALAGALAVVYLIATRTVWRMRNLLTGVLLGALNFTNIYAYVRAHQSLPNDPALVFSAMNIGVISLGTIAGVLFFRERLSLLNVLGLALALAAVALMTPW